MKELSLSLLSRGYGRLISSNTGGGDGRLDVCFTPRDYYIWKSQESVLRLSTSGRILGESESESAPPKTYSTRRGPLLLYSQGLVTIETNAGSLPANRKKPVVRRYPQHVEQRLSTLKELTAAILNYSKNRVQFSRLAPSISPPCDFAPIPGVHRPSPPLSVPPATAQPSPDLFVQLNSPSLHPEEQLENPSDDDNGELDESSGVRVDVFFPMSSRTPTPETQPRTWVHYVAVTSEEPEETQADIDARLQQNDSSQHREVIHHVGSQEEVLNRKSGRNRNSDVLLPPLDSERNANIRSGLEKTQEDRAGHQAQRLPSIAESYRVFTEGLIQEDVRRDEFPSRDNLKQLYPQPLVLPPLFPVKEEETSEKLRGRRDKAVRRFSIKQAAGGRGKLRRGSTTLQEHGHAPPPVGSLGCVAGRKGPGRQSSLAFLQNRLLDLPDLPDPCESGDDNRGVVKGVLPLELRDLQNGKSVGCVILGPDGEIIQLSLYNNSNSSSGGDPSCEEEGTQQQALQVLSAEGETLPWVILLQPECSHAEGDEELNTDDLVGEFHQHHPTHVVSWCKDPDTDTVVKTLEKTNGAVSKTNSKKEAKSKVRMTPLKEKVKKEEKRGGDREAQEEENEAETGQDEHLTGSHQTISPVRPKHQNQDDGSEKNIRPSDGFTGGKRKNLKKRDPEEAAATAGKSDEKSLESVGQRKTRGGRGEKQKIKGSSKSNKSQKPEEKIRGGGAETHEHSTSSSEREETRDKGMKEGKSGEVNKEGRGGGGGEVVNRKEVSAGKKRKRGRMAPKKLHVENDEDSVEMNVLDFDHELEKEEARSDSTSIKSQSSTQKHKNTMRTQSEEEDTDQRPRDEATSSNRNIQSMNSLRSSDAASLLHHRSSWRSAASSRAGPLSASAAALTSACGRLSSCSTVMMLDEQLMLSPVKSEVSMPKMSAEEATALRLAQRAERRRQEVERKRREREEEERRQQEREEAGERMRSELEEERRRRAEELRLKKLREEEERRRREEEEEARATQERARRDMERRRQEERRRQMERLQRMREEEEQRKRAEMERLRLEEQQRQEEEDRKLQEMDEDERTEYLSRKEEEQEQRRKEEEERRRREEEAALWARLQAEQLAREMALLHQQLLFNRGLHVEAGGLEKSQGISRPWIYSYFSLLQLLGLKAPEAQTTT